MKLVNIISGGSPKIAILYVEAREKVTLMMHALEIYGTEKIDYYNLTELTDYLEKKIAELTDVAQKIEQFEQGEK